MSSAKPEQKFPSPAPRRSLKRWAASFGLVVLLLSGLGYGYYQFHLPIYLKWFQPAPKPEYAKYLRGVPGIFYVAKVNDGFYRGSNPSQALPELKKLGIRTIINFRYLDRDDYRPQAEAAGFNYHWLSFQAHQAPTKEQIKEFLQIVNDPANQPVYIHCAQGIDRTGLMAGIYRIEHDGWSNAQALAEMNWFGHFRGWRNVENCLKTYPACQWEK
jgi:tyrosine-protein phosphatase SIW14